MPRIPNSIKSPEQIITGSGSLERLYRHARGLLALQDKIRAEVPGEVFVAAFEAGTLHLVTPSSALATRLRYQQRRFTNYLEVDGERVSAIRVSVRPNLTRPEPEPPTTRTLPAESARTVAEAADYIEDEALRKALLALSSRTGDPSF